MTDVQMFRCSVLLTCPRGSDFGTLNTPSFSALAVAAAMTLSILSTSTFVNILSPIRTSDSASGISIAAEPEVGGSFPNMLLPASAAKSLLPSPTSILLEDSLFLFFDFVSLFIASFSSSIFRACKMLVCSRVQNHAIIQKKCTLKLCKCRMLSIRKSRRDQLNTLLF